MKFVVDSHNLGYEKDVQVFCQRDKYVLLISNKNILGPFMGLKPKSTGIIV